MHSLSHIAQWPAPVINYSHVYCHTCWKSHCWTGAAGQSVKIYLNRSIFRGYFESPCPEIQVLHLHLTQWQIGPGRWGRGAIPDRPLFYTPTSHVPDSIRKLGMRKARLMNRNKLDKLIWGLSQIPPSRMKSRLMLPMSMVPEVKEKLTAFAEFYASLGKL